MASKEHTTVDIESPAHKPSLKQRLDALPGEAMAPQSFIMYRVPAYIRERHRIYYEPRILSIGPYHHGKPHLQVMEKHKMLYLRDFLSRPNVTLESSLSVISTQVHRARSCYFESIDHFSDDEFAEMLLLDGCFILEFLFKYLGSVSFFDGVGWMLPLIRSDLLMLENQIPFFVLQNLFHHLTEHLDDDNNGGTPSLVHLIVSYLEMVEGSTSTEPDYSGIFHFLHLYHCFYVPNPYNSGLNKKSLFLGLHKALKLEAVATMLVTFFQKKNDRSKRTPRTIHSATKLHEAGVKFKKKEFEKELHEAGVKFKKEFEKDRKILLDITFTNGILEIPFFSIEDPIRSRIMNLVAFEQRMPVNKRFFSSYVRFMDDIIDTSNDISMLCQFGILENKLTSNEEAAAFFNQLSDCAFINHETHYLAGLYRDVNKYCSSYRHEWRAKLVRDYFSNPWAMLSFGAAVFFLILTFLQTFFGTLSYFRPPRS